MISFLHYLFVLCFFNFLFDFSHGVFNKPVTCRDGHSFCQECITWWQVNDSRCPAGRSALQGPLVRNLAVEGAIGKKMMRCPSSVTHPGGCSWTGITSSLDKHLPHCNMKVVECTFKGRGCILCAYQCELAQHLLVCPHRTVKCPSCGLDIPHADQTVHDNVLENWYHVQMFVVVKLQGMMLWHCRAIKFHGTALHYIHCIQCDFRVQTVIKCLGARCYPTWLLFAQKKAFLYAVGCTKAHSLAKADSMSHLKLLLDACVIGACNVSGHFNNL